MDTKCSAITKAGKPCRGRVLPGSQYCLSHDPASRERLKEAQRRGGEGKSAIRRAVKAWTEFGREVDTPDVPLILYSCMEAVRSGAMTPGQATAIANLAKTAVSISQDTEMMERVTALEEAINQTQPGLRKVS